MVLGAQLMTRTKYKSRAYFQGVYYSFSLFACNLKLNFWNKNFGRKSPALEILTVIFIFLNKIKILIEKKSSTDNKTAYSLSIILIFNTMSVDELLVKNVTETFSKKANETILPTIPSNFTVTINQNISSTITGK